jgi:hypothetical protein
MMYRKKMAHRWRRSRLVAVLFSISIRYIPGVTAPYDPRGASNINNPTYSSGTGSLSPRDVSLHSFGYYLAVSYNYYLIYKFTTGAESFFIYYYVAHMAVLSAWEIRGP